MESHALGVVQVMLKRWKPFSGIHQWMEGRREKWKRRILPTGHVPVNCQMSNSSLETTMPYITIFLLQFLIIRHHFPRALSHAPIKYWFFCRFSKEIFIFYWCYLLYTRAWILGKKISYKVYIFSYRWLLTGLSFWCVFVFKFPIWFEQDLYTHCLWSGDWSIVPFSYPFVLLFGLCGAFWTLILCFKFWN